MRGATIAVLAAAALVAAAPASAKKAKVTTSTAPVTLAPGGQQAATARCPKGTHATGGGWSVSSPYSANGTDPLGDDSGLRIDHLQSQPSGLLSWTAGAAAFTVPGSTGTFSSFARCESKSVGRTLPGGSGSSTLPVSQSAMIGIHCPKGSHVLAGGFSLSPAGNLADPFGSRPQVVESRRRDTRTWEIIVVNDVRSPSEATIAVNTLCEVNAKGLGVSERSATAPLAENSRATATASCTGKTHAVNGGFLITPAVGPAVGVDQMQPSGSKAWQVGVYEYPGRFGLPAGSTVTAYSYCRKNQR
jgi:hypothetical protein